MSPSPATPKGPILGIDLGGSSVKRVVVTNDGVLVEARVIPFDPEPVGDFLKTIAGRVNADRKQFGEPGRIGVSAPGLAALDGQSIASMPGRLDGLVGLDWAQFLRRTDRVPVLNDGQAALLGEAWTGAARGCSNALLLTLGTGVGGAAIVDGHLLRGFCGKAGHFGHLSLDPFGPSDICGTPGSLEDAIGNHNIARRSSGRFASTLDLIDAVRSGDTQAAEVWNRSVQALSAAIASLANVLDPELVILGGGIAAAGDLLFHPVQLHLERFEWRPTGRPLRLVPAQLGEYAGAWGAARNALSNDAFTGSTPLTV